MSGILEWHRKATRYTEPELQQRRLEILLAGRGSERLDLRTVVALSP